MRDSIAILAQDDTAYRANVRSMIQPQIVKTDVSISLMSFERAQFEVELNKQ